MKGTEEEKKRNIGKRFQDALMALYEASGNNGTSKMQYEALRLSCQLLKELWASLSEEKSELHELAKQVGIGAIGIPEDKLQDFFRLERDMLTHMGIDKKYVELIVEDLEQLAPQDFSVLHLDAKYTLDALRKAQERICKLESSIRERDIKVSGERLRTVFKLVCNAVCIVADIVNAATNPIGTVFGAFLAVGSVGSSLMTMEDNIRKFDEIFREDITPEV